MSATYTADPTATEGAFPAPAPDQTLGITVPADGDNTNASTFNPAYRGIANAIAWLFKPRARANQWAEAIQRWRTAGLHTRFAVDHLAFPTGPWFGWDDVPVDAFHPSQVSLVGAQDAQVAASPHWWLKQTGSLSQTTSVNLGPIGMAAWGLQPTGSSYSLLRRTAGAQPGAYRHVVLEAYAGKTALDATRTSWIGLGQGSALPMTEFFGFRKVPGSSNWQAAAIKAGVLESADTGVAVPTGGGVSRLRVEYHGASVSDDGNERIRFLINGTLVATASLQITASQQLMAVLGEEEGAATSSNNLVVGPTRFRANYAIIDSAL